jgi:hypothetical protein
MDVDYEKYLDTKGIRKKLKRPGKLPLLDRNKLFSDLYFTNNGEVSIEIQMMNEF